MRTYAIYIRDVRYSVPSLLLVEAAAEERVADIARQKLEESPHHLAVEVVEGDTVLFRFQRADGE
ncbi:MAG TPA: hypothetical protein PLO65_09190 [Caulobacter sp.]|nr:hypothetical protein [Caulobacter sp.]